EKPCLMPVEDGFAITGGGTVATGRIERGKVKVGEEVEMVGFGTDKKVVVTGVEMFRKLLDEGQAGDNVGLLLRGVEKHEVERGMVLAKAKSITPHTQFESEVYVLTKEEGGRHTPFFKGYRPQFYLRKRDVTGGGEGRGGGWWWVGRRRRRWGGGGCWRRRNRSRRTRRSRGRCTCGRRRGGGGTRRFSRGTGRSSTCGRRT